MVLIVGAKLINQKNLLLFLATLLSVKFALFPTLEWQESAVEALAASSRQLDKVQVIASNEALYQDDFVVMRDRVKNNDGLMYADSDGTKLIIQRDLNTIFVEDGFNITGFTWVSDSTDPDGSVRVLRATVYFSGATESMIKIFWNISSSPKIIKIVDWRQQIKRFGPDSLGTTAGNVTLEFAASKRPSAMEAENLGGSDG